MKIGYLKRAEAVARKRGDHKAALQMRVEWLRAEWYRLSVSKKATETDRRKARARLDYARVTLRATR